MPDSDKHPFNYIYGKNKLPFAKTLNNHHHRRAFNKYFMNSNLCTNLSNILFDLLEREREIFAKSERYGKPGKLDARIYQCKKEGERAACRIEAKEEKM